MRSRGPWLVFAIAFVVVAGVMAGATWRLVSVERERIAAQHRAVHEEEVRLTLWRLDSAATPLLSQEIAAVGLLADAPAAAAAVPRPAEVRARFVAAVDGPVATIGDVATDVPRPIDELVAADQLLASLADTVQRGATPRLDNPLADGERLDEQIARNNAQGTFYSDDQQRLRNAVELSKRSATVDDNVAWYGSSLRGSQGLANADAGVGEADDGSDDRRIEGSAVRPVWIGDELVLVRRVQPPSGPAVHGSWLDWPALRARLQREVAGSLPEARLVPALADGQSDRLLATLPVRLEPGPMPEVTTDALGLLGPSLAVGWAGMLAAALAVFALLRWSFALSERRAAFVSAVTHELRTPLTTFRMYAEMLSEGMVEEAKRTRYLATLRREADRLGELVENVLTYSRIESDRAPLVLERISLEHLVERASERLEERARAAGLQLCIALDPELARTLVCADPAAVEQILFNLVDNAAKYGPSTTAPRIDIDARAAGRHVALRVRDHGPGVSHSDRGVIFEPFAKGAAEASGTRPGVGLGLALCRRLARQLGGDLALENAEPGARFVLTLPRARAA